MVHVLHLPRPRATRPSRTGTSLCSRRAPTARSPRSSTPTPSASWKRLRTPRRRSRSLKYLASIAELIQTWGALPAIESQRAAFFAGPDEQFAPVKVDWNVSTKMLKFPEIPSHEDRCRTSPRRTRPTSTSATRSGRRRTSTSTEEIDAHVKTLQDIFARGLTLPTVPARRTTAQALQHRRHESRSLARGPEMP